MLPFGGLLVAVPIVLAYLRFLAHLPAPVRLLVLGGGALYVGGAIGMEVVGYGVASYLERYPSSGDDARQATVPRHAGRILVGGGSRATGRGLGRHRGSVT